MKTSSSLCAIIPLWHLAAGWNIPYRLSGRTAINGLQQKGGSEMHRQTVPIVSEALFYIEENLDSRLDLQTVASALHCSKYHLHRSFAKTAGLTIHDYVRRRQLTEAARLLAFSKKPVIEIALMSGYESQQAFAGSFKSMYKMTPGEYRAAGAFYPLQLELRLTGGPIKTDFSKDDIRFAASADIDSWMELVRLSVDGYPCLREGEYLNNLYRHISERQAFILEVQIWRPASWHFRLTPEGSSFGPFIPSTAVWAWNRFFFAGFPRSCLRDRKSA